MLEGRIFIVRIDVNFSTIQQTDYISQLYIDIVYFKSDDNVMLAALSRINKIGMPTILTPKVIEESQANDTELQVD